MSSGARRDRDDRPRDWRDAHLSSGPSSSPKRKDGPDDRESDYRGNPRPRSDRRNNHRGRGGTRFTPMHTGTYHDTLLRIQAPPDVTRIPIESGHILIQTAVTS